MYIAVRKQPHRCGNSRAICDHTVLPSCHLAEVTFPPCRIQRSTFLRDVQVMVNLHSAHMDPDDWQQPQQFRPERFLDQSGNVVDRHRVIPFSLGEFSLMMSALIRRPSPPFLCTDREGIKFILRPRFISLIFSALIFTK